MHAMLPVFSRYFSNEKGVSSHTKRAYIGDLRDFLKFLDGSGCGEVATRRSGHISPISTGD